MAQPDGADAPDPASISPPSSAGLIIAWSAAYRQHWDLTPSAYQEHGVVGWGRSRRLARAHDASRAFKAYLGVQHSDPARWHLAGEPRAVFFLSLFLDGRTVTLRTFPTLPDALVALQDFHSRLTVS